MSLNINPETRVGDLLEQYPAAEAVLIALSPSFEKLRNPVVRRTVARVATLEQAARVGGVPLPEMIRRLREAAGQGPVELPLCPDAAQAQPAGWLRAAPVAVEIDADAMLERGVHPVGKVRESAAALRPGEAVRLNSSFRPEPLIETMRRGGFEVCSEELSRGRHSTWFGRR